MQHKYVAFSFVSYYDTFAAAKHRGAWRNGGAWRYRFRSCLGATIALQMMRVLKVEVRLHRQQKKRGKR